MRTVHRQEWNLHALTSCEGEAVEHIARISALADDDGFISVPSQDDEGLKALAEIHQLGLCSKPELTNDGITCAHMVVP